MSFRKIVLEYPVGWIDSDPLARQHLKCIEAIRAAASELGLAFDTRTSLRLADFAQRFSPDDTLLISVHSVGVSRNVVRLKESYLPGYYYFDRTGYSGWSELAYNKKLQQEAIEYNPSDYSGFVRDLREIKIKDNSSKYTQNKGCLDIELIKDTSYIFLALQTSDDLVARLAVMNQLELAKLLAAKAKELKYKLIIKRHPLCSDRSIELSINKLKRKFDSVVISKSSVNSLISCAKAVITVNSGVGFEALVMGVPVITAGRSDYSFVTGQIFDNNDISKIDTKISQFDEVKANRFVAYYLKNYCLNIEEVESAKSLIIKWMSRDYSSMVEISEYCGVVLEDSQKYLAELENQRRRLIMHHSSETFRSIKSWGNAFFKIYRSSLNKFKSLVLHLKI